MINLLNSIVRTSHIRTFHLRTTHIRTFHIRTFHIRTFNIRTFHIKTFYLVEYIHSSFEDENTIILKKPGIKTVCKNIILKTFDILIKQSVYTLHTNTIKRKSGEGNVFFVVWCDFQSCSSGLFLFWRGFSCGSLWISSCIEFMREKLWVYSLYS